MVWRVGWPQSQTCSDVKHQIGHWSMISIMGLPHDSQVSGILFWFFMSQTFSVPISFSRIRID